MALSRFEHQLPVCIEVARTWESKKQAALAVIPLDDLIAIAEAKFDSSVEESRIQTSSSSITHERQGVVRDLLLLELLEWFKNDFFTWTDAPRCSQCGGETVPTSNGIPRSEDLRFGASRIEVYSCKTPACGATTRFPRYNDPAKLLETRTGRCGEWANCFGLICRAAGFETRYVLDSTDHVWVEVFSSGLSPKNRWLHCDPCENVCDRPLLYEKGWGKRLSFVFAASHEDIQDVTWRYVDRSPQNMKQVLARRACDERRAVVILRTFRSQVQQNLSLSRKQVLLSRLLDELIELTFGEQHVKESEAAGRESGSLAWRLARQEISSSQVAGRKHIWPLALRSIRPDSSSVVFKLKYDCVDDQYQTSVVGSSESHSNLNRWADGVFEVENVARKEEKDWKMVYLARQEGRNSPGRISWQLSIPEELRLSWKIHAVKVQLVAKTFHPSAKIIVALNGEIITDMSSDGDVWNFQKSLPEASNDVVLSCQLEGGDENVAWQQTQLFRTSLVQSGENIPGLLIEVSLKRSSTLF